MEESDFPELELLKLHFIFQWILLLGNPQPSHPLIHFVLFCFCFCFETDSCCVALCGLELETLCLSLQNAGRSGMSCHALAHSFFPAPDRTRRFWYFRLQRLFQRILQPRKSIRVLQKSLICRSSKVTSGFKNQQASPQSQ